jgi:endoglucanase
MSAQYQRGVNLSGAEFGEALPGAEGVDYTFNSEPTFQYFAAKGLALLRIPIQWERMQPALNSPLNPGYLAGLKRDIAWAKKYGMSVIIEIQNFGRYSINKGGVYQEFIIDNIYAGVVEVSSDNLSDFWTRMSNEFMGEPTVYAYDLMNEPHDMGTGNWQVISQTVLTAIRDNGDNKLIMIPGDGWSGAASWEDNNGPNGWIVDPANSFKYEAHLYFDADGSGEYTSPYDASVPGRALGAINSLVAWCNANGAQCYVGEYGVPDDDPNWLAVLDSVLTVMDSAGFDGTYWSAGEFWGDYPLSVQPSGNFTVDRPQLPTLLNHLGA